MYYRTDFVSGSECALPEIHRRERGKKFNLIIMCQYDFWGLPWWLKW